MTSTTRKPAYISAVSSILLVCAMAAMAAQPLRAQTLNVLYSFSGRADGATPQAGLSMDSGGNLYGTTSRGGDPTCYFGYGCGTAFQLKRTTHGYVLDVLQTFSGANGLMPMARVVFGPDGALYGTTESGGVDNYGLVFRLTPPPNPCHAVTCPWRETVLHSFQGSDGDLPLSEVAFDQQGNLYGTTEHGGTLTCNGIGCGVVYEMSRSGGAWSYSMLHAFNPANDDGGWPYAKVTPDQLGNLYSTTSGGGTQNFGTVFELSPSGGSWQETVLHSFTNYQSGFLPETGVLFDAAGNLYGSADTTAYEMTPVSGGWDYAIIYSFLDAQPSADLSMDSAGNLYGTSATDNCGEVFELSPQGGSWTYTILHTFQGSDGCQPVSRVLIDASGNLYGTTTKGGANQSGVIWEITR